MVSKSRNANDPKMNGIQQQRVNGQLSSAAAFVTHTIDRLALQQKMLKQKNRKDDASKKAKNKQAPATKSMKASHDISSTFGVIDGDVNSSG